MSYIDRQNQLRVLLEREGLDALLLFSSRFDSRFIRWLTGITCQSAFHYYLLTLSDSVFLEISYRVEDLRAKTKSPIKSIPEENQAHIALAEALSGYKTIGLIGYAPFSHVAPFAAQLKDLTLQTESLLVSKTASEQAEIHKLSSALRRAIETIGDAVKPGSSELEIEKDLAALLSRCSDRLACPLTVISGPRLERSTVGRATERRLSAGDAVLLDAAIVKDGLFSDLTRMFFTGSSQTFENYQRLMSAQKRIAAELRIGMAAKDLLSLVNDALRAEQLPADTLTTQDLGHGIGFSLHEEPFFYTSASFNAHLGTGLVFTIEPEIKADGKYLRVEDMFSVATEDVVCLSE